MSKCSILPSGKILGQMDNNDVTATYLDVTLLLLLLPYTKPAFICSKFSFFIVALYPASIYFLKDTLKPFGDFKNKQESA